MIVGAARYRNDVHAPWKFRNMKPGLVEPRKLGAVDIDVCMAFALNVSLACVFWCEAEILGSNMKIPTGGQISRNRNSGLRRLQPIWQNNDLPLLDNFVGGMLILRAGGNCHGGL